MFDIAGDAMDIEEDGPSDPKIYLPTPLVSPSRTQLQAPNQHTMISEYGRPHHPHQVSCGFFFHTNTIIIVFSLQSLHCTIVKLPYS